MIKVSLIVATFGRLAELVKLLDSLLLSEYKNFEIIIVDQNEEGFLSGLIDRYSSLDIKKVWSEKGLSKARNVGMSVADGDILGFPDDDCWFFPNTLSEIVLSFDKSGYDFLSVTIVDERNNKYHSEQGDAFQEVNLRNLFKNVLSASLYIRKNCIIEFDESLGLGANSIFQSGEESDFVARLVSMGNRGLFHPDIFIGHPQKNMELSDQYILRSYSYALGFGRTLRKNKFSFFLKIKYLIRPSIAFLLFIYSPQKRSYYRNIFMGRLRGFLSSAR